MTVTSPERQQLLTSITRALNSDPLFLQAFIAEHPHQHADTRDLTLYLDGPPVKTLAQIIRRQQRG